MESWQHESYDRIPTGMSTVKYDQVQIARASASQLKALQAGDGAPLKQFDDDKEHV